MTRASVPIPKFATACGFEVPMTVFAAITDRNFEFSALLAQNHVQQRAVNFQSAAVVVNEAEPSKCSGYSESGQFYTDFVLQRVHGDSNRGASAKRPAFNSTI